MRDWLRGGIRRAAWSAAILLLATWGPGCSGAGPAAAVSYSNDPVEDFVRAVEFGDAAKVAALLSQQPALIDLRDAAGQTAIHYAVVHNNPRVIEVLVEHGMDPNIRDFNGHTPLSVLEDSGIRAEDARKTLMRLGGTN